MRELGIQLARALEILVRLGHRPHVVLEQRFRLECGAMNVGLVGLHRTRAYAHHVLERLRVHRRFKRVGDLDRKVLLDLDDVGRIPVVVLRPEVETVGRAYQLGRYADAIPRPAHGALEHMRYAEFPRNRRDVLVGALVSERRGARGDQQIRGASEGVENLLGEAVGKPFLVLTLAEICERQDGDRLVDGNRFSRCATLLARQPNLVDEQHNDGQRQHADDHVVQLLAGLGRDRLGPVDVLFEL